MKLAIVGAGKMGGAVLTGALKAGILQEAEVGIYHPDETRRCALAARYGVEALGDEGIHRAERVLIAVKPQSFDAVAPLIANRKGSYISLMAGVSAEAIARRVGSSRVVRAMPNLGARIGLSATALASLPQVGRDDLEVARELFAAVGTVYEVAEGLFDAFTGLAGSGPAFAAVFAEALADGGVRAGFDRRLAQDLARQVLLATAKLLENDHPAALKDEVASAGGTAIAGVLQLEAHGLRFAAMRAVEEAGLRAAVLSKEKA
jgi:pyrroline-5-carboxylate reductase